MTDKNIKFYEVFLNRMVYYLCLIASICFSLTGNFMEALLLAICAELLNISKTLAELKDAKNSSN